MRKIKFRVWITDWGNSTSHLEYIKEGCLHVYFGNWERGGYKNAIFQQYTGLKDKNGKEIYEGDIFKFSIENREKLCIAKFGEYTAPWDEMSDKQMGFYLQQIYGEYNQTFSLGYAENVVIAGNIFEHPELLK